MDDGSCLEYPENGDFALNHFYSDAQIKTEQGIQKAFIWPVFGNAFDTL